MASVEWPSGRVGQKFLNPTQPVGSRRVWTGLRIASENRVPDPAINAKDPI
jgi:hypothetical protein